MNTTHTAATQASEQSACTCASCPGASCTCGCRQTAPAASCQCGPNCQCGAACACAKA